MVSSAAQALTRHGQFRAEFLTRGGGVKVVAHDLNETERNDVWPRLVRHDPLWGAFPACNERQITVVALERSENHDAI